MAALSLIFGFLAIVLATVGLYGVISYMLTRRTNEIGIRMALGATKSRVLQMILTEAAQLLLLGLCIGIVAALGLTRYAESMLFGLKAHDPAIITGACVLLGSIGILASGVPALRAARLDPMVALREE
jgi:ABC-type antimicrobial peptide transport system permease subunit